MDWLYWAKFVVITATKIGLNAAVTPGAAAVVDFYQAADDIKHGNAFGAIFNIVTGMLEIPSAGVAGIVKDAMTVSAKEAVVSTAKETAKQTAKLATKKVGNEFGKHLATGVVQGSKEVAIEYAKQSAMAAKKEVFKTVGQKVSKELAMGSIGEAIEELMRQSTKSFGHKFVQANISSGGKQVFKAYGEGVIEELVKAGILNVSKDKAIKQVFELTREAAITGAKKHYYKLIIMDYFNAAVKGITKVLTSYDDIQ